MPQKIVLVAEEWTTEMGFLSASMKLRRREIAAFYNKTIEDIFAAPAKLSTPE